MTIFGDFRVSTSGPGVRADSPLVPSVIVSEAHDDDANRAVDRFVRFIDQQHAMAWTHASHVNFK